MRPTAAQKRLLASLAGPVLGLAFRGYRRALRPRRHLPAPDSARGLSSSLLPPPSLVTKILVVRLDAIGDMLLSEPALGVLRRRFPSARIDLVANPSSAAVLRNNPNVDRVIGYRAPWHAVWRGGNVNWAAEAARFWAVTRALRRERYDVGFELRGDFRDILFLAAAASAVLAGSGFRGGGALLDYDVPQGPGTHQVDIAAAIAAAGSPEPIAPAPPAVYPGPDERRRAAELLPGPPDRRIGLHLGAGFPSKCLPLESFAVVVDTLATRDPTREFVVVGGPDEQPMVDALQHLTSRPLTGLAGRLTLLETAAILERCALFIGNDSAPMHLAAAVGTPVVTFFGPSEPWKFHPRGVPYRLLEVDDLQCRPCDYVHCIWDGPLRYQCMTRQDIAAITAAAEDLLAPHPDD